MQVTKDLVAASATPMVLGILVQGESYGYAILKQVNELSGGELAWTDGLLYPLLHPLERHGHIESNWHTPSGGRRRKYYRITGQGRAELAEQRRQWTAVVNTLKNVPRWPSKSLRGVLSFCNARQMTAPEAYIQYSAEVFPGDGEVADEPTKAFLTAYMAEFRDHIVRVLTVLPREAAARAR